MHFRFPAASAPKECKFCTAGHAISEFSAVWQLLCHVHKLVVAIHSRGFSCSKALAFNLLSAVTAMADAMIAYLSMGKTQGLQDVLIPFAAGGFIYIALVDLIPELRKRRRGRELFVQVSMIFFGLLLMWGLKASFGHQNNHL